MAKRIARLSTTVTDDGYVHHDDRPVSIEMLESAAGKRLDRRMNYALIEGKVCILAEWSEGCSGCNGTDFSRGSGCHECGYTGRSRRAMWVPESAYEAAAG